MSVRITLPIKKEIVTRLSKEGKVQVYGQGYHYNPEKGIAAVVQKFHKKAYRGIPPISQQYRKMGSEGVKAFVRDLHRETADKYQSLWSLEGDLYNLITMKKKAKKLGKSFANTNMSKHAEAIAEGNISKGRKNSIKKLLNNLREIHNIARDRKVGGIGDNAKHKIPPELRELYENDYVMLRKNFTIDEIDEMLSSYTKFTNKIKDIYKATKGEYDIKDILEKHGDMLEDLYITSPIEYDSVEDMVHDMINTPAAIKHIFNSYLKELSLNSSNKNTRELAEMLSKLEEEDKKSGLAKVSPHIFYDIYNASMTGVVHYGMSMEEANVLFFYVNSNSTDGKKLPFNYLNHNDTMRYLSSKLLENGVNTDELTDEERFFLYANELLDSAISKLPKKENVTLYRGENVNPITFYAKKGDAIVYVAPVSTTPHWETKTSYSTSYISDNQVKVLTRETKQGAKVFATGMGSYQKKNGGVINGTKPEEYEGHREFLEDAQKELIGKNKYRKEYPAGSYLVIKAAEAYRLPGAFATFRNKNVDEHLLRPGTVLHVEEWKANPDNLKNGYAVAGSTIPREVYDESAFIDTLGTLLNLENWNVDERGRLIPKKRNNS